MICNCRDAGVFCGDILQIAVYMRKYNFLGCMRHLLRQQHAALELVPS